MIYAPNAVEHILTGKAIARAVCTHLLDNGSVNTHVVFKALKVPIPGLQDKSDEPPLGEDESNILRMVDKIARSLFDEVMNKRKSAEEVSAADVLTRIKDLLQEQRDRMRDNRTALLWLQYLDMVDILRMFIKAEQTGNWRPNLRALSEMLPYLAAALQFVRLYLQSMSGLETDHSDAYRKFVAGFHVSRTGNRLYGQEYQQILS